MGLAALFVLATLVCYACASPREQALAMLAKMTQAEKITMVHGNGLVNQPYAGTVPANTRLGIPAIQLEDGPQGVADGVLGATCWPSSLAIAAAWDEENMFTFASAMALEQWKKGTNVILGPDINIARVPLGGRIFEMFGEDPHLTSTLVVPNIMGIQSQGVIATAKHFVDNDQEYQRYGISIEVDERTNWELYYPPFQAAIDAGVMAVMCSYNKINGTWSCEQPQTLGDLKNGMGFQGFVMSDWTGTHSTIAAANAGLDMEMPFGLYLNGNLSIAIENGQVPQARLDDMVTRILTALYTVGAMNYPNGTGELTFNATSEEHNGLARYLAESAITLLQNTESILPLSPYGSTFAVLGDAGSISPSIAGGGSGNVIPSYVVTPLQGIQNVVGTQGKVTYAPTNPISEAVEVAQAADYAIVFAGFYSTEGLDRTNLSLPNGQDDLIAAVAAANPNTIVVLNGPGPILMPWASSVKAILFGYFPGQESGNAIANVLFGKVNPSAKLPVTFPAKENDWFSGNVAEYPGVNWTMIYTEKLLVGYKWYDAQNIAPLFPFGFGLSYTTYNYSNLRISGNITDYGLTITLDVQNIGKVAGKEIVQLYVGYPEASGEPPKVLRGFTKLSITPDATQSAFFALSPKDITIWDITTKTYVRQTGSFQIFIGASSRDIRLTGSFVA